MSLPPRIVKGRHTAYTAAGKPIIRQLKDAACASTMPADMGGRHIGFTPGALALLAYAYQCCDAYCTPAEELALDCYKQPVLWPLGVGPGITKRVYVYASDVETCLSARGKTAILSYNAVDGKWHGTLLLRGGSMNLIWEVQAGATNSATKFKLSWSGCQTGSMETGYQCVDPLVMAFVQIAVPICCACKTVDPDPTVPITTNGATITLHVAANCRRLRWGRHVGFTAAGIPVLGRERPCTFDQGEATSCINMECGVYFTVTNATSCACMAGTYKGDSSGIARNWSGSFTGCLPGPPPGTIGMSCVDQGLDSQSRRLVKLTLSVTCGATNTGTANVTILAEDLENLDVTFGIAMAEPNPPAPCCIGSINVRVTR